MNLSPKRKSFWAYYRGYFSKPRLTAGSLLAEDRRVRYAVFAVLVPATGYTLMYLFASIGGGAPSSFDPWLAIQKERYFSYNVYFVAPSMFMCWVLTSGVTQLLARLFSGKGSFEDTASVIGFGIGVATWSTLIHDLTDAALGALRIIDLRDYEAALNAPTFWRGLLWTLFAIYFAWFLLLFAKGIGTAHFLRRGRSIFLAVIALIVYQGVFLVFNR